MRMLNAGLLLHSHIRSVPSNNSRYAEIVNKLLIIVNCGSVSERFYSIDNSRYLYISKDNASIHEAAHAVYPSYRTDSD